MIILLIEKLKIFIILFHFEFENLNTVTIYSSDYYELLETPFNSFYVEDLPLKKRVNMIELYQSV